MLEHSLRKIGLSEGEIRVYTILAELGYSPINMIHERTGIERRNIYDILNKLIERGLVSYITENKKRHFRISHPSRIIRYLKERSGEIEDTIHEIEKALPTLVEKYDHKRPNIDAEVFRGKEGIKTVWEDMLNHKENMWIGSGRYVPQMLPGFFAGWNRRRIGKKIVWRNIMRHEMRNKIIKMPFEETRFLPKEFSLNPIAICVYGNKVVNFIFTMDFFAFVIESKEIAENYRRYHQYLWENVAKK